MARLLHGLAGDAGVNPTPAPGDEQLTFGVLGSLHVERGGRVVDCGGLKQRAVLALLIVNANSPLSAERMIDELWGDQPPPTALPTLQAYISNLRKALEPGRAPRAPSTVLISRDGTYELVVDADRVDTLRFQRLLADGRRRLATEPAGARTLLSEAVALWQGPALVEFVDYEFASVEIARLDELRIGATEALVEADLACGGGAELVPDLERLVAAHPLRERFWGQLMRAYYRAGRQADSLRAFRRCQELLIEELGIGPSPELRALEQAVLMQDPALAANPIACAPAPIDRVEIPDHIIGRHAELSRFQRTVDRAWTGHGSVLLIDGDPGVGKTRLLEAMGQLAADLGCRVALARCVEVGGSPPFWPWIQIVRTLGPATTDDPADPFSPFLQTLVSDAAAESNGIPTVGSRRYQLADGLVETMRVLGADGPIVVLIDDSYCADADSLAVLSLVGAAVADIPVVIVATRRSRVAGNNQPLTDVLVQLTRLDWCERLRLAPLDPHSIEELVHRIGGPEVDAAAVDVIVERAEGNAFFTVELARLLLSGRGPDNRPGVIPDTIREVVARRVDGLEPDAVALLRVAALIGRTFDVTLVADVIDAPVARALELADTVAAEGIVDETGIAGRYRFSHVLVIETIVAALGAFRRAQLHGRIAAVLEDRFWADEGMWYEIAHHRAEAVPITGPDPAIEALARAGRQATSLNALAVADQLLRRRHDLVMSGRPSPSRDQAELESLLDLSVVRTWRDGHQSEQMRDTADRVLQLAGSAPTESVPDSSTDSRTRPGLLQALQARFSYENVSGNIAASAAVAETMLSMGRQHPDPYVSAVANINAEIAALHSGRIPDAVCHSARVTELLALVDPDSLGEITLPIGQQSLTATHLGFAGWIQRMTGDEESARDTLRRGRTAADRSRHAFSRTCLATIECAVAAVDGSPEWVHDVLEWERCRTRSERFEVLDSTLDLYRHWASGVETDPVVAAAAVQGAMNQLDHYGASVVRTLHWSLVAELHMLSGRPADALTAVEAGLDHVDRFTERFWLPELGRLKADALGCIGDTAGSAEALTEAVRDADELGMGGFRRRRPV